MQKSSEKQVAGMAAASELLDAQIMKLKSEDLSMLSEGEKLARQVAIDNLETFAGQFRKAATEGRRQLDQLISDDARDAERIVDELTQPENAKLLDAAFVSGELDLLLAKIARSERIARRVLHERQQAYRIRFHNKYQTIRKLHLNSLLVAGKWKS